MSRTSCVTQRLKACFPRVSGDEPAMDMGLFRVKEFSPRERG